MTWEKIWEQKKWPDALAVFEEYVKESPPEPAILPCGSPILPVEEHMQDGIVYCDRYYHHIAKANMVRPSPSHPGETYMAHGKHVYFVGECPTRIKEKTDEIIYSFETFDRLRQPEAYDYCLEYSGERKLIFSGPTGLGKTHLARALMRKLRQERKHCVWFDAPELAEMFRLIQSYNSMNARVQRADAQYEKALISNFVFVDDLGSERITESELFEEQFQLFLNRLKGKIVITTNFDSKALEKRYGRKIISRLFEHCDAIAFLGVDYREGSLQKMKSEKKPSEDLPF